MKAVVLSTLIFGLSWSAHASHDVRASAFTDKNILYVTILGDACNGLGMDLVVDESCRADRKSRNAVRTCEAEARFISTAMYCPDRIEAKVLNVDLTKANVAPEARTLRLKIGNGTLRVVINKD